MTAGAVSSDAPPGGFSPSRLGAAVEGRSPTPGASVRSPGTSHTPDQGQHRHDDDQFPRPGTALWFVVREFCFHHGVVHRQGIHFAFGLGGGIIPNSVAT